MLRFISTFLLLVPCILGAQISIDDDFSDWTSDKITIQDAGDVTGSLIDITSLSIDHDTERIYFKLELNQEISFQENNRLKIYLDLDNNPNTGFPINGIGSELSFTFGSRNGYLNIFGGSQTIYHNDVGYVSLPTVTSDQFEFAFNRKQYYNGQEFVTGDNISVYVYDDSGAEADQIPNGTGGIIYNTETIQNPITHPYSLQKTDSEYLRIMSYNSQFDGFFEAGRQEHQRDIVTSMNPDIIAFQEIYNSDAADVKQVMDNILPSNDWYTAGYFPDIIVASKYPILKSKYMEGNGGFVICTDASCTKKILVIDVHFPCCDNDTDRQDEVDKVIRAIGLAKSNPNDALYIEEGTPIIILGDMNLVGLNQQLQSLLTGDIQNNNTNGPDVTMDWDGAALQDAKPKTTGAPFGYTWYSATSGYGPGRLDLMLYTESAMRLENTFSLATQFLSNAQLQDLELSPNTVLDASDHFPIISDFNLDPTAVDPLIITLIETENPLCFASVDGSISVQADAGEMPYMYSLNGGTFQANNQFDNLSAGTYVVSVKDNQGAVLTQNATLTQPDLLSMNITSVGSQLSIVASGGTPPYSYSTNNVDFQSSNVFDNLNRGIYTISLRDANGCSSTMSYELYYIIDEDMDGFDLADDCDDTDPNINPDATEIPNNNIDENCDGIVESDMLLVVSLDVKSPSCFEYADGTVSVHATGGELPYLYSLDGSNFQSSNLFENLNAGEYILTIKDNLDSEITNNFTIDDPIPLSLMVSNIGADIYNVATGGMPPYMYSIDGVNYQSSHIFNNFERDTYQLYLRDSNGCEYATSFELYYIIDLDMDGYDIEEDCDDNNPAIYPGAEEISDNGIDEDCDGMDLTTATHDTNTNKIKVLPNPFAHIVIIDLNTVNVYNLDIINSLGQIIWKASNQASKLEINTAEWHPGMYILRIQDKNTNVVKTEKLIKM